jgi:hypothetical protein
MKTSIMVLSLILAAGPAMAADSPAARRWCELHTQENDAKFGLPELCRVQQLKGCSVAPEMCNYIFACKNLRTGEIRPTDCSIFFKMGVIDPY